jgi:hypothetical protein
MSIGHCILCITTTQVKSFSSGGPVDGVQFPIEVFPFGGPNLLFTTMSLSSKFKKNLQVLSQTVDGTVSLDFQNPKLYKKILRYYEDQGVEFYDDPYDTYEYVIDLLKDLQSEGVAV